MRRFFAPHLPVGGPFRLDGEEGSHLARVLRARVGDQVLVFDGKGREVCCTVTATAKDAADLVIDASEEPGGASNPPAPARPVFLATAVPRGDRMEWLVEKTTEAGVGTIVGVAAARSVRERVGPNNLRRWRRSALEATKQCGRATIPDVSEIIELDEAIALAVAAAPGALFVAAPGARSTLDRLLPPAPQAVAIFVGPEGGFEPDEAARLRAAGAAPFSLGNLILRIETAALAAVHLAAR